MPFASHVNVTTKEDAMIDKSQWEFDYEPPIIEPKLPTKESEEKRLAQDCIQGLPNCKCKCRDEWISHDLYQRDNGSWNDFYFCSRCKETTQVG